MRVFLWTAIIGSAALSVYGVITFYRFNRALDRVDKIFPG